MPKLKKFIKYVDRTNEIIGKCVSLLVIPLTLIVMTEVIMRYVFSSPTIWAWDVNMYLGGLLMIMGAGYGHLCECHVSVDVILERWSTKKRIILKMILFPFIIIPLFIILWFGYEAAWKSVKILEHHTSLWNPPIYPLRIAIPVGLVFFILQAFSQFFKDYIHYRELVDKEKV